MDLPITPKSRALILRYEHLRPIDESIARDAVKHGEAGGSDWDAVSCVLHPFNAASDIRKQCEQDWAWAFLENERFADALLKKERECGVPDLPIHLFGCAPLVLMLHLGWCLSRRPLSVYQQDDVTGAWSLGYSRAWATSGEAFFEIEGLPKEKQGGRGHVALVIEVTNPIWEVASAEFQAQHPEELLATVRLWPARGGTGRHSVRGPGEVSSAMGQLREVLDILHLLRPGAESVLVAMNCPGSMAAAFGTAINPHTQHPLWLHQYNADPAGQPRYLPVYQMSRQRLPVSAPAAELSSEQWREVLETLQEVKRVHEELTAWLAQPKQKFLMALLGGNALLECTLNGIPATDERAPAFRHLRGDWSFHSSLLRRFHALRMRLEAGQWEECVRLFLVHEAYHVQQEGLDSYTYQGVGQAGWVLEAVDYDADVVSMEVALAWRGKDRTSSRRGARAAALESIIWNALESVRIFEPEWPIRELSERRLRRYIIWLFHACRLGLRPSKKDSTAQLDRVVVEFTGLNTIIDRHESYFQPSVRLDEPGREGNLELALYFRHKLIRDKDSAWIRQLLLTLSKWEEQPRKKAQDKVCELFERLFNRHPSLLTQD